MEGGPDKRHTAYQSIFGRPGPTPALHVPPPQQYYPQYHDRRTSYMPYQQQMAPNAQYLFHQPSQQSYGYQYPQSGPSLAPPSVISRARSINSGHQPMGVIQPQPYDPPDPTLDPWTNAGLTPAQAYQAQVYLNGPQRQQPSPGPSRTPDPPRLPLHVDAGRFNIDFSNPSGAAVDDGSELPWVNGGGHTPPPSNRYSQASQASSFDNSLYVDTRAAQSIRSSVTSASPSSFSTMDHSIPDSSTPDTSLPSRRSSESARTLPRIVGGPRVHRTAQDRSMSMSAATTPSVRPSPRPSIPPMKEGRDSPNSLRVPRKTPIVYPAMLSRVAEAFRDRITTGDRIKDGLEYKDAFDGREAVDKISYIIKTTDRNLALLLGRALDAQKFFHDVTYDHRLRDSQNELYRFRTKLPSPFVSGEVGAEVSEPIMPKILTADDDTDSPPSTSAPHRTRKTSIISDDVELPSGVFTLLTDCYSPTCSRDQLCYSIACPRRLEQQARLNMKPQPGLSKQISRESLGDIPSDGTLWIHSVPQEIVDSVSDMEKRRQEAINEVIYTERDFVRDMEYLRDVWIKRLQEQEDVIPLERRTQFLEQVFWNLYDIIAVNSRLRDALIKRQKSYAVVEKIGDILRDAVPHFSPFVSYGAHQLYGKYEFEKEKNSNPAFAQFVETTERLPESRKLELNAYLTKPTTRLARYPLLLEAVLKQTPDDNPDKKLLPEVIIEVRSFLARVNEESGKTENRFNLMQLDQQLVFRGGERTNLHLTDEGRELIYKGALNKRDGEINVYLFDHALLFTKSLKNKQHDQLRVYRPAIPLELLLITASEDATNGTTKPRTRQGLVKKASFSKESRSSPHTSAISVRPPEGAKGQYWINFISLGRKFYNLCLWSSSAAGQRKWLETIYQQQKIMRDRSYIFETVPLSEGFFIGVNKVNCAAPMSGGRRVVYGTNDGVYVSDLRETTKDPVKVLGLLEVVQIDVLEEYDLLIVLSERQVITFPLDALDPIDPMAGMKRAKRISSHTSFFKAGYCLGKILVCIVKSTQLSSTFKTLEPIDQNVRGRNKPTFKKLLQGGNDTLKMFREFYIPVESTSIHYLKTRMCVGCSRGFEIVDLETLDTQGLLDPHDPDLEFVRRKENLKPMAIYRILNEFLLCYDEFAFYVNKTGRRSRKEFLIQWEGVPTGFAFHEPFVLAFEPSFVEIRHIETGALSQVIQGSNLRLLFADNPPSNTNNNSTSGFRNPQYPQQPPAYGGYGHPQQHVYHPSMNTPSAHNLRHLQSDGRDEILMVSDDRVLALRVVAGDGTSMRSIPR